MHCEEDHLDGVPASPSKRGARAEKGDLDFTVAKDAPLPDHVDAERADARVDHGVLTVRFPKQELVRKRRIPIGN
jgi:HSP20 family molecular chaperone IbpA